MSSNLNKLVQAMATKQQNEEKLALPLLTAKLKKLAKSYPFDQTIVMAADVLCKAEDKKQLFISRAEFRKLYRQLYSRNTKFADYMGDELGPMEGMAMPKLYETYKPKPITDIYEGTDKTLTNVMKSALDNSTPQWYSEEHAAKAVSYVNMALDAWNLKSNKVSVANGNQEFILVKAEYETPKGLTGVVIPVEIKSGKVLEPTMFLGDKGLVELNHNNVKEYVLAKVKQAPTPKSYGKDIEVAKAAEAETFEAKLKTAAGVASLKFGKDKMGLGRDAVVRVLAGVGVEHPQVSIVGAEDNTMIYGVSAHGGRLAFKVPVKVASNKVLMPEMMICNGTAMAINKANINKLFVQNQTDFGVAASTSALHGLTSQDLIATVEEAASNHNYAKAEDALNVLQQSGDEKSYKLALDAYKAGLTMTKNASTQSACNMIIKSASSQYPVCGHTGLPTHKVYQDEHGDCHPLYRKNVAAQTTSAYFNNYKVLA